MKNKSFPTWPRNEAAEGGDGGGGAAVATPPAANPVSTPASAAPDPAAATPSPVFNPDGTFAENWPTALGPEFADYVPQLSQFKDVKGLAKSYAHLRATGPQYPSEASTPEDVSRFHALAKVPVEGTPTAYGLNIPENASEEGKAFYSELTKVAHENHLSGPGFAAVVAKFQELQGAEFQKAQDARAAEQKAAQDALIGEWRGDFEANKSIVRHRAGILAERAGIDPESPHFKALADNPDFARLMIQVAKTQSEDSTAPGGFSDLRSPQERANAIMDGSDPQWGEKYTKGTDEQKREAYKVVSRLLGEARK